RVGPALDIAIRYQLPIHYACTGQKVPEDLVCMDAEAWIDRALMPVQPASALFSPSAADLAALMETPPDSASQRRSEVAMNGSLLPGLLALAGPQAAALDAEFLRTACAELDSSEVFAGAYRLWRRITARADTSWRPWTAARSELAMLGQERMLALHDGFGALPGPARSKLHATLLLGEGGGALASPWQQWPVGQGWQASDGSSEPGVLSETERLRRCIRFVEGQPGAASVVHLFN